MLKKKFENDYFYRSASLEKFKYIFKKCTIITKMQGIFKLQQ